MLANLVVFVAFLGVPPTDFTPADAPAVSNPGEMKAAMEWRCPYVPEGFTEFTRETREAAKACKAEILAGLRDAFEDFNITFTDVKPAVLHRTLVYTNESQRNWKIPPWFAGLTLGLTCAGDNTATSVVFNCNEGSWLCVKAGVHELGHQFGLQHVNSKRDVMHPILGASPIVFADKALPTLRSEEMYHTCRRKQNSYALLMIRLGPSEKALAVRDRPRKHQR